MNGESLFEIANNCAREQHFVCETFAVALERLRGAVQCYKFGACGGTGNTHFESDDGVEFYPARA